LLCVVLVVVLGLSAVSDARMMRGHSPFVARGSKSRESTINELVASARSLEDDDEPTGDELPSRSDVDTTYSSCRLDLAGAIATREDSFQVQAAKIKGLGMRFAVCAIQEVEAEKSLETLRSVIDFASKPVTAPIDGLIHIAKTIKDIVTLEIAAAIDDLIEIAMHASGVSLYFKIASGIIHVISSIITDVDVRVTLCSLCAVGLSYAMKNVESGAARKIMSIPRDTDTVEAANIKRALTFSYTDTKASMPNADICSLHPDAQAMLASATSVDAVLKAIAANKVYQLRGLILYNIRKFIEEPATTFSELADSERHQIEQAIAKLDGGSGGIFDLHIEERDVANTYFNSGDSSLPNLSYISKRGCHIYCTPYRKIRYCCDALGSCSTSERDSSGRDSDDDVDSDSPDDSRGEKPQAMDRCSEKTDRSCYSSCDSKSRGSGKDRDCSCVIC